MKDNESQFSSKFGVVAATAGSAIGLGNLWGFSYKAGIAGGGYFIAIYFLFVAIIGFPIMVSEFIIGKAGKADAITCYEKLDKKNTIFKWSGIFSVTGSFLILTFYSVIAGWSLIYFYEGLVSGFDSFTPARSGMIFNSIIKDPYLSISSQIAFMLLVAIVLLRGIEAGIEKISKILMLVLFSIILTIAIIGFFLPGAQDAYKFLFMPSLERITNNPLFIANTAMTQAFFSLSLGAATIITYGSYVDKDTDIISVSRQVIIADTFVSLLAGIAIFPIVFSANLNPSSGAGLMFVSLPTGFRMMIGGRVLGVLFFGAVVVAALTSAISLLENTVSLFVNRFNMSRTKIIIISTIIAIIIGLGSQEAFVFSMKILRWTGKTKFLDQIDKLALGVLIPISTLFTILFTGYRLEYKYIEREFKSKKSAKIFYNYIKIGLPILIIFLTMGDLLEIIL